MWNKEEQFEKIINERNNSYIRHMTEIWQTLSIVCPVVNEFEKEHGEEFLNLEYLVHFTFQVRLNSDHTLKDIDKIGDFFTQRLPWPSHRSVESWGVIYRFHKERNRFRTKFVLEIIPLTDGECKILPGEEFVGYPRSYRLVCRESAEEEL